MTESAFQSQVLQIARRLGWLTYHTHDSRRSTPGFPDLVLVHHEQLLFVELKTDKGKTTAEQARWIAALRQAGQKAEVWRPRDMDRIVKMLTYGKETA